MAADTLGGKPVQALTLSSLSAAMLLGPMVAMSSGVAGLHWLYFLMGLFAGPSHPAVNASMSEWFPQEEMGVVNSVADMYTAGGELAAAGVVPVLGFLFGWRSTFLAIGVVASTFTVIWMVFAKSKPDSPTRVSTSPNAGSSKDEGAALMNAFGFVFTCLPGR